MPRAAAQPSPLSPADLAAAMLQAAMRFVPPDRAQATMSKWLPRTGIEQMSEDRKVAMMADAVLLSADLLKSQPSASGATAIDRLAKSLSDASPAEAAALSALRQARFRLVRLEGSTQRLEIRARDVLDDTALRIVGAAIPPVAAGMVLFARVVMLGDDRCCFAGAITPLDPDALAIARDHPAAGARAQSAAGARWAEAVYAHVVRNGTLDVPGLNRPREGFDDDAFDDDDGSLAATTVEWLALADGVPDAGLLRRTRALADLPSILDTLVGAALARAGAPDGMADALERMLSVQLETVRRRERGGSNTVTLAAISTALDDAIAAGRVPAAARPLFAKLRARIAGTNAGRPDDPALERLMQRIQGLRAKTVAQGCTEQEALAAAEKVAELLDRHGLSLGELDFRAQPCEGIGIQTNRLRFAPIDTCVPAIAAFFDCRVWLEHAKGAALRYVFFGLRGDVAAAQYLYEMVDRAFDTETDLFRASGLYAEMAGERRSATHSFQTGLSHGIANKLKSMRAARDSYRRSASGRDLVPVKAAMIDEEMAKLGLDLHTRKAGRGKRVLTDAFDAGEAAGQRFEFAPAISDAA